MRYSDGMQPTASLGVRAEGGSEHESARTLGCVSESAQ
jgi:hypothetical protein